MTQSRLKPMLKKLGLAGAIATLSLGGFLPQAAQAGDGHDHDHTPKICKFSINISAGTLEGNRFYGSFSFDRDRLTGEGEETVTVEDDGLEIAMVYLGRSFYQDNDRNYPEYPRVTLQDGKVALVDFWVDPRDRDIWWEGVPGWDVQLTQTDCELN